jgi:DNA-binding GntR family transcriptional regulator
MSGLLEAPTVVDALYRELRQRIISGGEVPGTPMTEVSVSTSYGVARPTAKAAIERLVADGLLVRENRRLGAVVPTLTPQDIEDLYLTRAAVEISAYTLLGARGASVSQAALLNANLATFAAREDAQGVVDSDVAFHRKLVESTGSPRLLRLHSLLMAETHLCMAQVQARQLLSAQQIWSEHEGILDAIRGGDSALIAERAGSHLDLARAKLMSAYAEPAGTASPARND